MLLQGDENYRGGKAKQIQGRIKRKNSLNLRACEIKGVAQYMMDIRLMSLCLIPYQQNAIMTTSTYGEESLIRSKLITILYRLRL